MSGSSRADAYGSIHVCYYCADVLQRQTNHSEVVREMRTVHDNRRAFSSSDTGSEHSDGQTYRSQKDIIVQHQPVAYTGMSPHVCLCVRCVICRLQSRHVVCSKPCDKKYSSTLCCLLASITSFMYSCCMLGWRDSILFLVG